MLKSQIQILFVLCAQRHYYVGTDAVIFVVDSQDNERLDTSPSAMEELQSMLAMDELRGAAVLVFANKQDLPKAISVSDVASRLGLPKLARSAHNSTSCAQSFVSSSRSVAFCTARIRGIVKDAVQPAATV